jgi:hypothetical protein
MAENTDANNVKKIKAMAEQAAFFSNGDEAWFRMQFCHEESFNVLDEDTGDEHEIQYNEVDMTKSTFYKVVPIEK